MKNKKGQIELDEPAMWVGIILGLIGAGLGLILAKRMDVNIFWRLLNAIVIGVVCFFVGWKISDSG